jgi:hypothetical protein
VKKTRSPKDVTKKIKKTKKDTPRDETSSDESKVVKKKRKTKDPNRLKNPPSAYLLFCADYRRDVVPDLETKSGTKLDVKQVVKLAAKAWDLLKLESPDELSKYKTLAAEAKVVHAAEKARRTQLAAEDAPTQVDEE